MRNYWSMFLLLPKIHFSFAVTEISYNTCTQRVLFILPFSPAALQTCSQKALAVVDPCCSPQLAPHFFLEERASCVKATMNLMEVLVAGAQQGQVGETAAPKRPTADNFTRK